MSGEGPFAHWRSLVERRDDLPPLEQPPEQGKLPPAFQFSQNSLQDYADCARRFQLRYVIGQPWPAARSEPIEQHEHFLEQGTQFHLLVQRHLSGIPVEKLTPDDPLLKKWWDAYLDNPIPRLPGGQRHAEIELSAPVRRRRLLARFDLLAVDPGERAVIVDWKTTRKRPSRELLGSRLQSRVYPFVLVEAGQHLFGGPLSPQQVSLVYWFAEDPAHLEVFPYDSGLHEQNRDYLTALFDEIDTQDDKTWPLTPDERHCLYCVYRSLCDRGEKAGPLDESEIDGGDAAFDFDLDTIDEIAF